MAREPRNCLNSNFYHIMVQGINKEYVFEEDICKKVYLKLLFQNCRKFNNKLISYCVMDNHVHIILYVVEIEKMSKCMKSVNGEFAQFYNKLKNRVGPVFRDRFKSQPIYNEKYLYSCVLYVHRNPVKAGLTERVDTYKFSSTMKYSIEKINNIIQKNIEEIEIELVSDKEFIEIDDYDENIESAIDKIIEECIEGTNIEKININELNIMEKIIKRIRNETNASFDLIAKKLNISRSTAHRYSIKDKK